MSEISNKPASEMTVREHFAAMAMQGILANAQHTLDNNVNRADIAVEAIRQADALIKALEEG